jgi:hypothetical protein
VCPEHRTGCSQRIDLGCLDVGTAIEAAVSEPEVIDEEHDDVGTFGNIRKTGVCVGRRHRLAQDSEAKKHPKASDYLHSRYLNRINTWLYNPVHDTRRQVFRQSEFLL